MSYSKLIKSFMIALGLLMCFSCNMHIEKRRYLPGYHVSRIKKNESGPVITGRQQQVQNLPISIRPVSITNQPQYSRVTSVVKNPVILSTRNRTKSTSPLIKEITDKCDEIVLYNGQKIQAKIEIIGEREIRYKNCDDPKGLTHQIMIMRVSHINLGNGDVFQPKTKKPVNVGGINKGGNTVFVMSIIAASVALICFIFSFLIYPFPFTAFILAIIDMVYSVVVGLLAVRFHSKLGTIKTKLALFLTWLVALLLLIAAFIIMFI